MWEGHSLLYLVRGACGVTYPYPRNTQAVTLLSLLRDSRYFSYMREHHEQTFLPRWCVRVALLFCVPALTSRLAVYLDTGCWVACVFEDMPQWVVFSHDLFVAISSRLGMYRIDSSSKRHIAKFLLCTQVLPAFAALAVVRCEGLVT